MGSQVYLTGGDGFNGLYTMPVLAKLCRLHGIELVDSAQAADYVFFSACDPDDLKHLVRIRADFAGTVVLGGFEAFCGVPWLAYADYVVVGYGLEFMRAFGVDPGRALRIPCVLHDGEQEIVPDYSTDWDFFPVVKVVGKKRYYFLGSKGCRHSCSFCATSAVQPYSANTELNVKRAVRWIERKGGCLTIISNESSPVRRSRVNNSQSVTVRQYLRDPARYKAAFLRFGIEGWTEESRRSLGKPLDDEVLTELFAVTRSARQRCEVFFMIGYPGWSFDDVQAFAENVLPVDAENTPAIYVKGTYFDPCPHTRLGEEEINPRFCDMKETFRLLNSRNKRVRVFPTRSMARSAWRGCFHRAIGEEVRRLGPEPRDTNRPESWQRFQERLSKVGLESLLSRRGACSQIKVRGR